MKRFVGTLASCLAAAVLFVSCIGEPTGPGARVGALAIAPRYANLLADAIVDVSAVRIRLLVPETNVAVVDTTVAFPVGVDSIAIRLTVPLESGLDFLLVLAMTDAAGDTVFRAGPIPVKVSSSPFTVRIAEPVLTYVGVGANATAVRFVNPPLALNFGQTSALVAEALDAQGTVIPGTPIGYELVDPADSTRATIPDPKVGSIIARSVRGVVPIRAVLATGQTVQHSIAIQPVATNVIAQQGAGQTGTVGAALAQPLVARVRAADGLGVQGIPVNFEVLTGGGTLNRLVDTTDVNGDARATLTLGTVPGAQSARAVVPSLGGATAPFAATALSGAATQLVFGVQPTSVASGLLIAPAVTVRARDQFGNDVTSFTGNISIALLNNPSGAVLGGTLSRAAVAGVATFNDLALSGLGAGITLQATSGALTAATSSAFNVTIGAPATLSFTVQPPATSSGSPFIVAVAARDAGGNIVPTFVLPIALAIGTNPAGGTLSGLTTVTAVAGVATFVGLSIDNVGTGYTLNATRAGLTTATSVPFNVGAGAGVNAWINATGGNWSTPGNWSLGTVPTAAETVWIRQSGTYTVNLDVAATVGRMLVGGSSGTQTLAVSTGTLTMNDSVLVNANGAVTVTGGAIAGTGAMAVASSFTWNGGNLSATGASVRVLAGGTLAIGGTATRSFSNFVLENAGTASWTGAQTINSGSGATIRVFAGATMNISGDPIWSFNQGGAPAVFDVQGALTRTTSAGSATVPGLSLTGSFNMTSGAFEARDAGTSSGSFTAAAGTILRFALGTHTLTAGATVQGAGTVLIGNGSVTNAGTWNVAGTTRLVPGGTLTQNATGTTGVLDMVGGVRAGSGLLNVTGSMAWSSGDLNGGGGLTRVAVGATLVMSGPTARTINAQTLEIAGIGVWFESATINTGGAGTLRVAATGSLEIQADPTFTFSQGGTPSLFQNLGAVLRSVSTGIVTINAPITNAGSFTIQTGIVDLRGNGTLGGGFTVPAPGVLRFSVGTYAMQPGFAVIGTGSASLEGATLTGLAAGDTAQFNNFFAQTGALNPGVGGVVRINTLLDWSGAASLGGGGSTRVMPAANVSISGATARTLNNHTLANEGTATWTGAATINSGSAARIRNSGTFNWAGDGAYLFNQGGATSVFENLGAFNRTGTGVAQLGAQLIDTLGTTFNLQAGELRASNGGRIGGTKTLSGGVFEAGGGTLSMRTGMLWAGTGGYVRVTAGTLTLDSAATVTMPRLDLAGGLLTHEGLVDVITAMNWSGGDITSNTVGGGGTTRVRAGGLLTVSGTADRTLSGSHLLQLLGATNYTASGTINSGSGATISNAGLFDLQGSGSILWSQGGAASTFVNAGPGATLRSSGATTGRISFPIQNTGALSVTGDTLELAGGSVTNFSATAAISSGALFLSGGTFTLTGPLTTVGANAHLTVGGTLNLGSFTTTVGGNFATTGAGVFQSAIATTQLNVTGNVSIAGGASTATAGQLQVGRNFVQGGAANAFVASGTHRTLISGSAGVAQNITFANAPTSRFNRLDIVDITRNIVIQSNVFVADTLLMRGGSGASNLIGAGTTQRLTANGALVMIWSTLSPRLAPPVLEINATPAVGNIGAGGGIQADTTVFIGGNVSALPTGAGYNYRSIRVGGATSFSFSSDTIAGDLHIASNLAFFAGSATFRVGGKLRVTGAAQFAIVSNDVYLTVVDSTIFSGASTNGLLTSGNIIALGAFVQAGDPAAFSATGTFRVQLYGGGLQQVRFTNPGQNATTSHFADLQIGNSSAAGIQFLSPVFAGGTLFSQFGRLAVSRISGTAADSLSITGVQADSITFDGVPLRIGGNGGLQYLSVFTFQNMNPAVNQFTISRDGLVGVFTPNQVVFSTVPSAGANYLVLRNTSVVGLGLGVTFFNSSPPAAASMTGRYLKQSIPGPIALIWNGTTLP